ncbi:MAG TPA: DbpA RNA binding domain-containing protein, partial [Halioglobus sp.]
RITEALATADLAIFKKLVQEYQHEYGVPVVDIAAALGSMAQGKEPLRVQASAAEKDEAKGKRSGAKTAPGKPERPRRERDAPRPSADSKPPRDAAPRPERKPRRETEKLDVGMERFRLEVGHVHGVKPGNIVGAIANEAEIESEYIGRIEIFDDYSTVDLPEGMPKEIMKHLKSVWVSGQRLQISRLEASAEASAGGAGKKKPGAHRRPAK